MLDFLVFHNGTRWSHDPKTNDKKAMTDYSLLIYERIDFVDYVIQNSVSLGPK